MHNPSDPLPSGDPSPPTAPPTRKRLGWGSRPTLQCLAGIAVLAAFFATAVAAYNWITCLANQHRAVSKASLINGVMLCFAAEHNGQFPDSVPDPATGRLPQTANAAFRHLFREDPTLDEKIFGYSASPYQPDSLTGGTPNHLQALQPGENHWALVAHLNINSDPDTPLLFENPAVTTWPPQWRDTGRRAERGRA